MTERWVEWEDDEDKEGLGEGKEEGRESKRDEVLEFQDLRPVGALIDVPESEYPATPSFECRASQPRYTDDL